MNEEWLQKINWPKSGKYVVAVSGGVDSVVLLDLLVEVGSADSDFDSVYGLQSIDYSLIVAHLDHGMRLGSEDDRQFVQNLADGYGLGFEFNRAELQGAGEAEARRARYDFLYEVQKQHQAQAVITAHHRDDQLETSLFNALRGGHWQGIAGISERENLRRPLLEISKNQIKNYAESRGLNWREDPTNQDVSYSRNYLRHRLIPLVEHYRPDFREDYFQALVELKGSYQPVTSDLEAYLKRKGEFEANSLALRRYYLWQFAIGQQLLLLRMMVKQVGDFYPDQSQLHQLRRFALAGRPHKQLPITEELQLEVGYDKFSIQNL